jgi:hypothetical protein
MVSSRLGFDATVFKWIVLVFLYCDPCVGADLARNISAAMTATAVFRTARVGDGALG